MKYIYPFLALLLVSCAQPQTMAPQYTSDEVARERTLQKQYLENNGKARDVKVDLQSVQRRFRQVAPDIRSQGMKVCSAMYGGSQKCDFPIQLAKEGPVNAWADGTVITITPAMVAFTKNDAELAMVLAHEYAHNILKHPESMQINATSGGILGMLIDAVASSQGYNTGGTFSKMGSQYGAYRYSVDFEKEADYVGLYIVENGGYNMEEATDFWRRMTALNPDGIYGGDTHPSNPERFIAMKRTHEEIKLRSEDGFAAPKVENKRLNFGF